MTAAERATASYPDLDGKVAVVTGGAQGIGATFASALVAQGATVVVLDLNGELLERTVGELAAAGSAGGKVVDVTDGAALRAAADAVAAEHGRLDVWINNAGIYEQEETLRVEAEAWRRSLDVNLLSVLLGAQAAAPHMAGGGAIVNMASIAAFRGMPRRSAYAAAKAGVQSLTRTLAVELGGSGIRVNALSPGYIETPMLGWLMTNPEAAKARQANIPLGRFGTTAEVAAAMLFLVSDAGRYVTGHTLAVDGGWLIGSI